MSSSRSSTCSRRSARWRASIRRTGCRAARWRGLVSGTEEPGTRSEIFSELTYHAAYEPQRAIRTERFKYVRRFDDYPYPLLDGRVPAPPGALINGQDQLSAGEPTFVADGEMVGAASDARE